MHCSSSGRPWSRSCHTPSRTCSFSRGAGEAAPVGVGMKRARPVFRCHYRNKDGLNPSWACFETDQVEVGSGEVARMIRVCVGFTPSCPAPCRWGSETLPSSLSCWGAPLGSDLLLKPRCKEWRALVRATVLSGCLTSSRFPSIKPECWHAPAGVRKTASANRVHVRNPAPNRASAWVGSAALRPGLLASELRAPEGNAQQQRTDSELHLRSGRES